MLPTQYYQQCILLPKTGTEFRVWFRRKPSLIVTGPFGGGLGAFVNLEKIRVALLDPRPWTLDPGPKPVTLDPRPHALDPRPQALDLKL
eukprot:1513163-Rhodomonas_salina.2